MIKKCLICFIFMFYGSFVFGNRMQLQQLSVRDDSYNYGYSSPSVSVAPTVGTGSSKIIKRSFYGWNTDANMGVVAKNFKIGGYDCRERLSIKDKTTHGTYWDEWGIIGAVAVKVVPHGGYFCLRQIQCANLSGKRWVTFFDNTSFGATDTCYWLCEDGFSGEWCKESHGDELCDVQKYQSSEIFPKIVYRQEGGWIANVSVPLFLEETAKFLSGNSSAGVVGIIEYKDHGVIAAPIRIFCDVYNGVPRGDGKDTCLRDSFYERTTIKVLCASGYKSNPEKNDCVPINPEICRDGYTPSFCEGYTQYNSKIHTAKWDKNNQCFKYLCKRQLTGFRSQTDHNCKICATKFSYKEVFFLTGVNDNGLCVNCETGQYFNNKTKQCEQAVSYNKTDLQYGKGRTYNSPFANQCWLNVVTSEYVDCMEKSNNQ